MLKTLAKIQSIFRISKETLVNLSGGTPEKSSEVTRHIKALAFVILIKNTFRSSHIYGHSHAEIAQKLGMGRNSFDRNLKLAMSLGYIEATPYKANNNRSSERLNYVAKKIGDTGYNMLIEVREGYNLKDIQNELWKAYFRVLFINRSELLDKIRSQIEHWNMRGRKGVIKRIGGFKNPSPRLTKVVDNLCQEIRDLDLSGERLRNYVTGSLEQELMTISVNGIQRKLNISGYRHYKTKKVSSIQTIRNVVILDDETKMNWRKEMTDYWRKAENIYKGWWYVDGVREVIVMKRNTYRLLFDSASVQKHVFNNRRAAWVYGEQNVKKNVKC